MSPSRNSLALSMGVEGLIASGSVNDNLEFRWVLWRYYWNISRGLELIHAQFDIRDFINWLVEINQTLLHNFFEGVHSAQCPMTIDIFACLSLSTDSQGSPFKSPIHGSWANRLQTPNLFFQTTFSHLGKIISIGLSKLRFLHSLPQQLSLSFF